MGAESGPRGTDGERGPNQNSWWGKPDWEDGGRMIWSTLKKKTKQKRKIEKLSIIIDHLLHFSGTENYFHTLSCYYSAEYFVKQFNKCFCLV